MATCSKSGVQRHGNCMDHNAQIEYTWHDHVLTVDRAKGQ